MCLKSAKGQNRPKMAKNQKKNEKEHLYYNCKSRVIIKQLAYTLGGTGIHSSTVPPLIFFMTFFVSFFISALPFKKVKWDYPSLVSR